MTSTPDISNLAEYLDKAAFNAVAVQQLSTFSPISLDDAYEVQKQSIARRLQRGEKLIGLKMGFTSEAKMQQMGVHDMIWGRLTSAMLIPDGDNLAFSGFIHPRAEPEICFRVSKDIDRELSLSEAAEYVDGVAAAIEIIDSRYENFKFSLEDVVADNCSSAAFVTGNWYPVETQVNHIPMELVIDGAAVEKGNSADILGDPWKAFCAATRLAVQYGEPIKKGMYIMAGAATAAAFIKPGQTVTASAAGLHCPIFNVK
jgi:2-oxo-3-hexenedioate decarboxylase